MKLIVSVSIKDQKFLNDKTFHIRGEVRILNIGELIREIDRIPIKESNSVVMKGHHKLNGGVIIGSKYLCTTYGQVLTVDLNTRKQETVLSEPFFNDLHHVSYANDEYAVVNTGLEQLLIYDCRFNLKRIYNLLDDINVNRTFDLSLDYRHVWSTKPHYVHPNYCFYYDGEWWVTRFLQKDAIGIDSKRRISLESYGNPHDGLVMDDCVYFTTTNGWVVKYNFKTRTYDSWNLNELVGRDQLGWCRGLAVIGDKAYVCFTKFRSSRAKEMVKWIIDASIREALPSRILEVDLKRNKITREISFQEKDLTLFSLTYISN
ncbi:MAG: hypothetical protein H0Z29_11805 [Candidatus Marinimicrobia bacterium]|nr:hypothetical protein [Candidatus Neomarinimicrobiota bacterium]